MPLRRFNLGSLSLVITCACKLDKPERFKRLLKLFKRFSETSNAYRRPVFRINAPSAKVFPPAPAQKSATIIPRLGATRCANIWLPSSCISILPSVNNTWRLMFKRCGIRIPIGEYGVNSILVKPEVFSAMSFCNVSSRVAFIVLTRKSKLALSCILRAIFKALTSPYWAISLSHNQSRTSACTAKGMSSVLLALMVIAHSFCCSESMVSNSRKLMPCTRNNQARMSLRASSGSFSSLAVIVLKKRKRRKTP